MLVSYGKAENRLPHLNSEHLSFDIKQCTIGEGDEEKAHHVYLCRKEFNAMEKCAKNWEKVEQELKKDYEDELK